MAAPTTIKTAWFASDLHLDRADPEGIARACRFLEHVQQSGADHLFLLGDVFKAWLGPRSLRDPGLAPFLEALGSAVKGGLSVMLTAGNHDFLIDDALHEELGVTVALGHHDVDLGGQRVRLVHGDVFCTDDVAHQRAHAVLRSRPVKAWARWISDGVADRLGRAILAGSSRATARKSVNTMAIVDAAVVDTLEAGVDTIVCGHVHTARDEVFELSDGRSGRLVVMADFESTGSHAIFRDGELSLVPESRAFARPIVTLDGPAGSGKSSVARELARRLAFVHLDSGALYRAITAAALDRGTPLTDDALGALAVELDLSIDDAGVSSHGQRIPDARLRGADVSAHVSQVSAHPQVRAAVLPTQRAVAERGAGVVAEGRDMGTVVFPEATFRIWLDASPEVRAARRMAQNAGEGRDLETVTAALRERDERDSSRSVAPLAAPEGGLRVDTSDMSREQVVDRLVALVLCGGLAEAPQDGG